MYAGTMSGDLLYTYQYLPKYCDGPYFKLTGMSDMVNMLHTSYADSIVEVKAMGLLLYNNMAQEMTDIYGSVPYFDFKNNKKENPFTFDKPEDIYKGIISNIDDIVACLGNFGNRPQWYQDKVRAILSKYDVITLDKSVETLAPLCQLAQAPYGHAPCEGHAQRGKAVGRGGCGIGSDRECQPADRI